MTDKDLLLTEGDRLARQLMQVLPVSLPDTDRVTLLGRSLAVNLVGALMPTIEQISRRQEKPLHAVLNADPVGNAVIQVVTVDGEVTQELAVRDVLEQLLFMRGRLHPSVQASLTEALHGDEHHATRHLVSLLRSKPVLDALQKLLLGVLN